MIRPPLHAPDSNEITKLISIQSRIRGYLTRKLLQNLNKKRRYDTRFTLQNDKRDYYLICVVPSRSTKSKSVYAIINQNKIKTPSIDFHCFLEKYMGRLRKESFPEFFKVDTESASITYTDEALYWLNKY